MAKKPTNAGKAWTPKDNRQLEKLADGNTPTRLIALKMGRSTGAIYSQAAKEDISLKPTNQSPYGPRRL